MFNDLFSKDVYVTQGLAEAPPVLSNFLREWKEECRKIKARCVKQFSIYATCGQLRAILAQHAQEKKDASRLRRQQHAHTTFITEEPRAY